MKKEKVSPRSRMFHGVLDEVDNGVALELGKTTKTKVSWKKKIILKTFFIYGFILDIFSMFIVHHNLDTFKDLDSYLFWPTVLESFNGTIDIISSSPPLVEWNARFTTLPFKPLV